MFKFLKRNKTLKIKPVRPTNTTGRTLRDYQEMRKNKQKNVIGEKDFMELYGNISSVPVQNRSYYGALERPPEYNFDDENEDIREIPFETMGNLTKEQARELAVTLSSRNPTERDLKLQKKREEREAARLEYLNTFWDKLKQKQLQQEQERNKPVSGGKLRRRKTKKMCKRKKCTNRRRRN